MTRGAAVRLVVAGAILAVLVRQLGADPFLRAFAHVTPVSLVLATVVVAVATLCCAWRWSLVARHHGLELPLRAALPAYYRSQLLNQVLPGGVLGDVHRAVRHGSAERALTGAARAVVWERVIGQVALGGLTLLAVLVLPSVLPVTAVGLLAAVLVVALAAALAAGRLRAAGRPGPHLGMPLLLSVAAVIGHLLVLLVALRLTGVEVGTVTAVPMLLVVLVASSIPTNIGGWGPREGAAAWVFGAAGIGAAEGVTVTSVYAILSLVATLPGALVLLTEDLPRRREAVP